VSKSDEEVGIIRQTVATILDEDSSIAFAYLFGSVAIGGFRSSSDVDIAIMFEGESPRIRDQLALHHKLAKALHRDVDLLVLNTSRSYSLWNSIVRDGIPVVNRVPERRFDYEVGLVHDCLDFMAFRELADA